MAIPLSGVVGGPLSGALLGLSGRLGLAGWQWLFLLEGLPAVALGFVVLGYLTDSPQKASWLSPVERTWLTQRLSEERERCRERHGLSLRQALFNGTVWQLGVLHFLCFTFGTYVLGLWLPQIIRGFSEFSDFKIGLVSAVPNLAGAVSMGSAFGHGLWAFLRHYVFKAGFRDGWAGFVIAFGNFEGTFYRYAKRHEQNQDWQPPPSEPLRREPRRNDPA